MNRHVVLTSGRSGSNYLTNTLNLHPMIVNYGEVLGAWTLPWKFFSLIKPLGVTTQSYLEYIYTSSLFFWLAQLYSTYTHWRKGKAINYKHRNDVKTIGIKDFFFNFERRDVFGFVLNQPNMGVIYLRRTNLLRRYVSMQHMRISRVVVVEEDKLTVHKMIIDIEDMLATLAVLEDEVSREHKMLVQMEKNGHRVLRLSYEDYFSSPEVLAETNDQMFSFLGLEPITTKSRHKKILPEEFADMIDNYSEFRTALIGSQYEKYLAGEK